MLEITRFREKDSRHYTDLTDNSGEALFFHTDLYRDLLKDFLDAEPIYILAKDSGRILGAIPCFLKRNEKYGNVLNSLPFFGSNGGFIVRSDLDYKLKIRIKRELLNRFLETAEEKDCILSTIVTSPLDRDLLFYEENIPYKYRDFRIGQIIKLGKDIDETMSGMEKRTRGSIKRALKHDLSLETSNDFQPLYEMHQENIGEKGGVIKPEKLFKCVFSSIPEKNLDLIYAKLDDEIVAGLLVLHYNKVTEYFLPGFYKKFAKEQGTSFLMFKAMKSSISNGRQYWNLGGTGKTQKGLYKFKKGFGALDMPYYYYTVQHKDIGHILNVDTKELLEEYKWFYLFPFKQVKDD